MPSRLREIQAEWNALVPQAAGIARVRMWTIPPASIWEGEARLNWLKAQLLSRASTFGLGFGVEIESMLPQGFYRSDLRRELIGQGISVEEVLWQGSHRVTPFWKLTTDSSISHNMTRGTEVVSPILLGDGGFVDLRTVCQTLTRVGARILPRCGLHVHVGVRPESVDFFKRLVKMYGAYEEVIDSFLAPSRRANRNSYCQSIREIATHSAIATARSVDDLIGVYHMVRRYPEAKFSKLNLVPHNTYGTVEFRHHQGSTDPVKVENWVRFCLRMVTAAKRADLSFTDISLNGLMDLIEVNADERRYFINRAAHFASQNRQ
jgi:hypothetical protein